MCNVWYLKLILLHVVVRIGLVFASATAEHENLGSIPRLGSSVIGLFHK